MRTLATALFMSALMMSAPAFAHSAKKVMQSANAASTDSKPVDAKSSAPVSDASTKSQARKVKKQKSTKMTPVKSTGDTKAVIPTETVK